MSSSEELLNDPDYVSATSSDQIQQKIYEETGKHMMLLYLVTMFF